jgi:hypothetical protein
LTFSTGILKLSITANSFEFGWIKLHQTLLWPRDIEVKGRSFIAQSLFSNRHLKVSLSQGEAVKKLDRALRRAQGERLST